MRVQELDRDQITELKQSMLFSEMEQTGMCPSYGEIAAVDETISDDAVMERFADCVFSCDDFACSAFSDC